MIASTISLNADLHCHSLISDGVMTPSALAQRAAEGGVHLWSLTDHDELSGLAEAQEACRQLDLPFVPGVEISATWAKRTVHIVGLNIDPAYEPLERGLATIRAGRVERARH